MRLWHNPKSRAPGKLSGHFALRPRRCVADITPPELRTTADCVAAIQKLTDAMCRGDLDVIHGKVLLDAIATQAKLIEGGEMEARLAELERQAGAVDFRPRRA